MRQNDSVPDFYNDINLSFAKAWDLIEPGATKRASPAHTPVVGSVNEQGEPQLRVMVLRAADRSSRRLRFHTDIRSTKIVEIENCNSASVLMYDPDLKLQLRLSGYLSVASKGDDVDSAWETSTTFARRCYMAEYAPGSLSVEATSGLPLWIEGKQPEEDQLGDARANFALLWFEVRSLQLLYLANVGHRRAKWDWDDATGKWSGRWLVP
jgi:hypothetical protein